MNFGFWSVNCESRRIGIWLGNDDAQPMRNVTGSGLPAKLFRDIATAPR